MMVRALERENSIQKSKSFNFKKMFELPGRQIQSFILENGNDGEGVDDKVQSRSYVPRSTGVGERLLDTQYIGSPLTRERGPVSRFEGVGGRTQSPLDKQHSGK